MYIYICFNFKNFQQGINLLQRIFEEKKKSDTYFKKYDIPFSSFIIQDLPITPHDLGIQLTFSLILYMQFISLLVSYVHKSFYILIISYFLNYLFYLMLIIKRN